MRDYVIVTDATADLPKHLHEENYIQIIPMEYEIEKEPCVHCPDRRFEPLLQQGKIPRRELTNSEFYQRIRNKEMATTSQINVLTYKEVFTPILKEGKDVLYIAFSSGLSGTIQSAFIAIGELKEEFPERQILCADSLAASIGQGLLVFSAVEKQKEGMSLSDLYHWILENRNRCAHWFTVSDLHFLRRGGRISAAAAVVGSAVGIKPVLHVDDEGHLIPFSKVRGRRHSLTALIERMAASAIRPEEQVLFIAHADNPEDVLLLKEMVLEQIPVKDSVVCEIGPIVGAHSGPDTMVLAFYADEK